MKKTDLIVGETYACHMRPVRGYRSNWEKPFKATLVSLGDTLSYTQLRVRRDNGAVIDTEVKSSGIIVELDKPRTRRRDKYELVRGYGDVSPEARKRMSRNTQIEEQYTRVALENAGCIRMTWAEWEAEQAEKEAWEKKRAAEDKAHRERITAEEPEVKARVERILDAFAALPGARIEIRGLSWNTDSDDPRWLEVYVPTTDTEDDDLNTDGEPPMRRIVSADYLYSRGVGGKDTLVGLKFELGDEAMEQLLLQGVTR